MAENPNWCAACKGNLLWSISLDGPWCRCERGKQAAAGLARLLDPFSVEGKALAGCLQEINRSVFGKGKADG